MTLTVTGVEPIELTDPLDLCQPQPRSIPVPKKQIPTPFGPSGGGTTKPRVTPIPNIGDPINPIPLPRRPWTDEPGKWIRRYQPDYPTPTSEKWGRGLTAAVSPDILAGHGTEHNLAIKYRDRMSSNTGEGNGHKDAAYS